ncbi:MAG: ATP-binding protein [Clostridiales bacterium]|nr:ATP-binding protein [Clostridiales bacterium]
MMKNFTRICFAGPPGSGKSTVITSLRRRHVSPDFIVMCLDEVATLFLKNRTEYVSRNETNILRQFYIFRAQLELERTAERVKTDKPVIVISDRGIFDAFVYLSPEERKKAFSERDLGEINDHKYDHVLYFLPGNERPSSDRKTPRIERSDEETDSLRKRSLEVWNEYASPETVTYIPVFDDIKEKSSYVAEKINALLGEKVFLT